MTPARMIKWAATLTVRVTQATKTAVGRFDAERAATDTAGLADVSGLPGDTDMPGSDIQFPGDDALVQNDRSGAYGPANAVGGEIADPVSDAL